MILYKSFKSRNYNGYSLIETLIAVSIFAVVMVIAVDTSLSADEMMQTILRVETEMGRIRTEKWGARVIDIDILFFNNDIISHEHLKVPHPHLHERKFVLKPMAEIMPGFIHPVMKKRIWELLEILENNSTY